MSHTHKSKGAHGPWYMDDDQVSASGPWTGDLVDDFGTVTLDGASTPGDVVNVGQVAAKVSTGGLITVNPRARGHRHNKRRR